MSLNLDIPTYLDVLADARFWRATGAGDAPSLVDAEQILRRGMADHPYALPLADELALVLEKQGRDDDARRLLDDTAERYRDAGEETLCRLGKLFKKLADKQLLRGETGLAAAVPTLIESERQYGLAFEKAGGFYPRINQLTVRLVLAGVLKVLGKEAEAERLVQSVREGAAKLLADPQAWLRRKPDDHIWIPATQGEAHALLGAWGAAEVSYLEAVRQAGGKKFYHDCMRDQLAHQLLPAYHRLELPVTGRLADPHAFFQPASGSTA